jgi:hypothetical protein
MGFGIAFAVSPAEVECIGQPNKPSYAALGRWRVMRIRRIPQGIARCWNTVMDGCGQGSERGPIEHLIPLLAVLLFGVVGLRGTFDESRIIAKHGGIDQ